MKNFSSYYDMKMGQIPMEDAGGRAVDPKVLDEVKQENGTTYPLFDMEITDNGLHGSGVRVTINYDAGVIVSEDPIAWFTIPENSIPLLIKSLQMILDLREMQTQESANVAARKLAKDKAEQAKAAPAAGVLGVEF